MGIFTRQPEQTKSEILTSVIGHGSGQPVYTSYQDQRNYGRIAYTQNVDVKRCVDLISDAVARLEWSAGKQDRDGGITRLADTDSVQRLIQEPNPYRTQTAFLQEIMGDVLTYGNLYVEGVTPGENRPPRELWRWNPHHTTIIAGNMLNPVQAYEYRENGTHPIRRDPRLMLHLKTYNPANYFYGTSPILSVARWIDQQKAAEDWNTATLQTGFPAGYFKVTDASEEEKQSLRWAMQERARKMDTSVGVIDGDIEWIDAALTAKDVDFLEGHKHATRKIAQAYGVPPELLGDNANKTYANYQEARKAFYQETVLAWAEDLRENLTAYIQLHYGDEYVVVYDTRGVDVLQANEDAIADRLIRLVQAGIITPDEARNDLGMDALPTPAPVVADDEVDTKAADTPGTPVLPFTQALRR